jgi:signal transduction histidine kinase
VFALAVTLVGASLAALTQPHGTRPYLVFPPLIWAALRFGPRGATVATLAISIVTLASTIVGQGAFVVSSLGDNLMALDAFVASVALTALVLGATAAERSRALRAREHFISIASHELRTPLAPLRLQVQRLLRGLRRGTNVPTTEAVIDGLVIIDRQVERLTALLENVLDLTRLRLGRLPLAAETFDLATLVDEIASAQRDAISQHGGSLRIDRHGPTTGTWDRARLAQVVTNLLANAVKHGGGSVEISLAGENGTVTIVVRDHGPGIPTGAEERIFRRFEHADAADDDRRTSSGSGLGLGLYIAREIVEAHRGRLSVERPIDGGAAFKIELPSGPDVVPPVAPRS